jgi:hypothetical protein
LKAFYDRHHRRKVCEEGATTVSESLAELRTVGSRYYCVFNQIVDPGRLAALELGLGCPPISNALASVFGSYLAFDIAAHAMMASYEEGDIAFKRQAADLNQGFPVPTASVHVVIATMVIEHLLDPFHVFVSHVGQVAARYGLAFRKACPGGRASH